MAGAAMFGKLRGRIACLFGRHHRSKGRARLVDDAYVSVCRYCGVQMRQRGNKDWFVDR